MSLGLYLSCALGALVWQFCFGLRAILLHQVIDFASDGLSGTRTFARQSGISQLRRWAARVLVPAELAGLLVLLLVVHDGSGAVLWFVVAYLSLAVLYAKPITAIRKADVEHVRRKWIAHRPGSKNDRVGANGLLARLRHLFRWAITEGHVARTPFSLHGVPVIKLDGEAEAPRTRRLEGDEEERLLTHAELHLRDLIIAELETGCRVGEVLALRWCDIKWDANVLILLADVTKPHRARDVPMSRRLKAVLEMRRHAPDGTLYGPQRYVFGNDVGERAKFGSDGLGEHV